MLRLNKDTPQCGISTAKMQQIKSRTEEKSKMRNKTGDIDRRVTNIEFANLVNVGVQCTIFSYLYRS
jgi:hypothetical protein